MSDDSTHTLRLGYYIPKPDGRMDLSVGVDVLPQELWQEIKNVIYLVPALRPIIVSFLALEDDFKALSSVEAEIAHSIEVLPNSFDLFPARLLPAQSAAQRHTANFLGSCASFRDRVLTWFSTEYGASNPDLAELPKSIYSAAYDTSFAYRVLYNLRNHALHHNVPISLIPISGTRDTLDGRLIVTVKLMLDRAEFCSNTRLQAKVRKELAEADSALHEILPLATEYMQSHRGFMEFVLNIHSSDFAEMRRYALLLLEKIGLPEGAVPVVWEGEEKPGHEPITMNYHHLSFDELGFISLLFQKLRSSNIS